MSDVSIMCVHSLICVRMGYNVASVNENWSEGISGFEYNIFVSVNFLSCANCSLLFLLYCREKAK